MRERIRKFFPNVGIFKILLLIFLILVLVIIVGINLYINSRDVSALNTPLPEPTIIYDKHGNIASKVPGPKIEGVSYTNIPQHVIHAVIAIEDHRFYKHPGVDYIGLFRALFRNLKAGGVVEGGSTITQQLTKNVFLTHEQTLDRKIEEYFLAQKIERTYSKDKIIEMYVNQIYFGEGAWGIKNAALTYFGKDVQDLTVSEGAILAGLIKAPSRMNPLKDINKSKERRDLVLDMMGEHGFLTSSEVQEAKAEKIVVSGRQSDPYRGKYPYYIDTIIEEAIKKYNLTENEILFGGLQIYTELNPSMQERLEAVFKNDSLFPSSPSDQLVQSSAILLDPKSGGINAIIGGRGEHVFRGYNRATQMKRQPGSTMKPLAVYTPALEKGYSMYDELPDKPMSFNGYQPANVTGSFKGNVTIYDALTNSDNIPAVWLLNEIGLSAGIQSVERFGISLTEEDHNLSLALGGISTGVAPIHMAEAYTTFPNEGKKEEAHSITKIMDLEGNVIAQWSEQSTDVTTPEVAKMMTYMLKGVVEHGTGEKAKLNGRELAAKTGSTQVPIQGIDGVKDKWVVGYTPELVGAVWLGYDHTDQNHYLTSTTGAASLTIFKEMMEQALKDTPASSFNLPVYQKPKPKIIEQFQDWWAKDKDKEKKDKEKKEKGKHKNKDKKKEKRKKNKKHWKDDD